MISVAIPVLLAVIGLMMGSFVGASMWRLRATQLREDKLHGHVNHSDAVEVKHLKQHSLSKDRSVCLECGHKLRWYDLIPIVSWVYLDGKCRYCNAKIGVLEPILEVGLATVFVVSYVFWPNELNNWVDIALFVSWLVSVVGLSILLIYDAKWFLLPNKIVFPLIGLGVITSVLYVIKFGFSIEVLSSLLISLFVLAGIYYVIYVLSKHQYIGFGDIKLGIALALLVFDARLAILTLFLANFIGVLVILPGLLSKKVSRRTRIPFGPFLILAYFISVVFGSAIVAWYFSLTSTVTV